jgi:hypothetical protein
MTHSYFYLHCWLNKGSDRKSGGRGPGWHGNESASPLPSTCQKCTFIYGTSPSSPPATTKVSINYLFLLLSSILACFSWGVGGNGFGGLSGFFVLHWKVSSWWTPLMTINNGRRVQQNAVISFRSKTMHSTLHSKAKGSKKNMLNVGLKTTKGIAYSEKETMPHAITYRKHHTMLH